MKFGKSPVEHHAGVEVRSRRIGGATFQIPTEVRPDRKVSPQHQVDGTLQPRKERTFHGR